MIVRMFAPDYDSSLNKHDQFSTHRGARGEIQQEELFQRQWLPLLLGISDLDDDIEIGDRSEEW